MIAQIRVGAEPDPYGRPRETLTEKLDAVKPRPETPREGPEPQEPA